MLAVDLYPLYPVSVVPGWMTGLRKFYVRTYKDAFFVSPPPFFQLYLYLELLYHLPLSMWAIGALWRDDPKVPIHLLVYAVQTAVTTATCIAEVLSWESLTAGEKGQLGGLLYGSYAAVAVFMGVDMWKRLDAVVERVAMVDGVVAMVDGMKKKKL